MNTTRTAPMASQPTLKELKELITNLSIVFEIPSARSEATQALVSARKRKTLWVGHEENALRFKLDHLLDEIAAGWRTG